MLFRFERPDKQILMEAEKSALFELCPLSFFFPQMIELFE